MGAAAVVAPWRRHVPGAGVDRRCGGRTDESGPAKPGVGGAWRSGAGGAWQRMAGQDADQTHRSAVKIVVDDDGSGPFSPAAPAKWIESRARSVDVHLQRADGVGRQR